MQCPRLGGSTPAWAGAGKGLDGHGIDGLTAQDLMDQFPTMSPGWAHWPVQYCAVPGDSEVGFGGASVAPEPQAGTATSSVQPVGGVGAPMTLADVIQWHQAGLLDADEFKAAKGKVLHQHPPQQPQRPPT